MLPNACEQFMRRPSNHALTLVWFTRSVSIAYHQPSQYQLKDLSIAYETQSKEFVRKNGSKDARLQRASLSPSICIIFVATQHGIPYKITP